MVSRVGQSRRRHREVCTAPRAKLPNVRDGSSRRSGEADAMSDPHSDSDRDHLVVHRLVAQAVVLGGMGPGTWGKPSPPLRAVRGAL